MPIAGPADGRAQTARVRAPDPLRCPPCDLPDAARSPRRGSSPLVDLTFLSALLRLCWQGPRSNRACRFPAHGLPTVFSGWLARDTERVHADDAGPSTADAREASARRETEPAVRRVATTSAGRAHERIRRWHETPGRRCPSGSSSPTRVTPG